MDEVERLFVIRIRDPLTRGRVRGRLGDMGANAVTDNIWELPKQQVDDPADDAQWWDEQLGWFENVIDKRTDVIYIWTSTGAGMVRTVVGGGE